MEDAAALTRSYDVRDFHSGVLIRALPTILHMKAGSLIRGHGEEAVDAQGHKFESPNAHVE